MRRGQQLGGSFAQNWMAKSGSKLSQGNEHEPAFGKPRMGNLHPHFMNFNCSVEKNIEIDNPRAARDLLPAAELAFNGLKRFEQLARPERSIRFNNTIQEPWLLEKIHGLRLIGGRPAQNSHANIRQALDGAIQIRGAIAKV